MRSRGITIKTSGDFRMEPSSQPGKLHRPSASGLEPGARAERVPEIVRPVPKLRIVASPTIELAEGNLLTQKVDAIVNSWNCNLIPHWMLVTQGVSGAIKKATGTGVFDELREYGVLPLGAARLTSAGSLPLKGIIHVAGINHFWRSSEKSIRDSVSNALVIARNEGYGSVAIPAIGAGSSIAIGRIEIPIWGVSRARSLAIIADQASRSDYSGKVVIVKFKKAV